ncbi:MAG: DUF6020 family protein [Kineothrix sp.]
MRTKGLKMNGIKAAGITKRETAVSAVTALLYSFFLTAGWQMERKGQYVFFSPWPHLAFLVLFLILFPVILWSLRILHRGRAVGPAGAGEEGSRRNPAACRGFRRWKGIPVFLLRQWGMLLGWLPVLLAGYPGFFCYDAAYQFNEVAAGVYDMQHPLLHTWLLGRTLTLAQAYLGSYEAGVLIFCVTQMLVITACFCLVLELMERRGAGRRLLLLSWLYYALYPTCALFGLCTTKDSLFTAFVTLHLMALFEMLKEGEAFFKRPAWVALYAATAVLAMLFRNNGFYSWLLFLPILLLLSRGSRKKAAVLTISCMGVFLLVTRGLAGLLEAEDRNGLREMLSVPAQQLARTYAEEGAAFFEEEDRARLYSFIPEEDLSRYSPKLADPVKANLHVGLNSTLPDFVRLWLRIGIKAPGSYIDALLLQTYQAWYPFTIPDGYCGENAKPRYRGSESCYFALETEEPAKAQSRLPGLLGFYRFFSRHMTFDTVPVLPILFSVGTMLWVLLYALAYALCYSKRAAAGLLLMLVCLCLTCLLGPIVLVRYYLVLFFALPLVAGVNQLV